MFQVVRAFLRDCNLHCTRLFTIIVFLNPNLKNNPSYKKIIHKNCDFPATTFLSLAIKCLQIIEPFLKLDSSI